MCLSIQCTALKDYCAGGSTGIKDGPSSTKVAGKAGGPEGDEEGGAEGEGETYYDFMKKEMGDRAARTRAALDAMDPEQRVAMEGHRPGAYLRLRFTGAVAQRCRLRALLLCL